MKRKSEAISMFQIRICSSVAHPPSPKVDVKTERSAVEMDENCPKEAVEEVANVEKKQVAKTFTFLVKGERGNSCLQHHHSSP